MNLSGNAISSIAKYYKIKNEDILIIYDDMSLNIGEIKIKDKGSSAGHNGDQINNFSFGRNNLIV